MVFRDVTAPWLASALTLAVELRLAERLDRGSLPLGTLALQIDLPERHLRRFLGILQAHGYFKLDRTDRLGHTALSRALLPEAGGSFVALQGRSWYRAAFDVAHVLEGCRVGCSPFEVATGRAFFDRLDDNAEDRELFSRAMSNVTRFCAPYLVESIPLLAGAKYLDVGGADGEMARALAFRYPGSSLAIFDRSPASEGVGLPYHQGSFFQSLPTGYDGLCLKSILHDWPDQEALAILCRCREAVEAGASLFVIECLLPSGSELLPQAAETFALDWNVWLTLSGQERTEADYRRLLEGSGWEVVKTRVTATPYSVIEARAVSPS